MPNSRQLQSILFAGLLAVSVAGCGSDSDNDSNTTTTASAAGTTAAPANAIKVSIDNFAFSPSTLTIKAGQTVTWTNNDSTSHTVTSGANRKSDGKYDHSLAPGDSWSWTYQSPGTFDYYCKPHSSMVAKIIVQ